MRVCVCVCVCVCECVFVCVCVCVYLVSLLAARDGAGEGLLVASIHAHGAEDGLRADGALRRPRLVTVRLLKVRLLLVILTTCRSTHTHRSVHTRTHTHTNTHTHVSSLCDSTKSASSSSYSLPAGQHAPIGHPTPPHPTPHLGGVDRAGHPFNWRWVDGEISLTQPYC